MKEQTNAGKPEKSIAVVNKNIKEQSKIISSANKYNKLGLPGLYKDGIEEGFILGAKWAYKQLTNNNLK